MSVRFYLKAERRGRPDKDGKRPVTVSEFYEGDLRTDARGLPLSRPAGRVDEDIKVSNKDAYEAFRAKLDPIERQEHERLIAEFLEAEKPAKEPKKEKAEKPAKE